MNSNKTNKQQIIEKYCQVLTEFIAKIQTSESILASKQLIMSLSIGITSIHRVFEYTLLKTKQLDKAYYQAQQTYYYFIEYLEQINQSHLVHTLNHKDAILFVYKKAIFEVHDGNESNKSNSLENIMTLSCNSVNISDKEWRTLFIRISKFIQVFLCWNSHLYNFSFRIQLCERFLEQYLINIERLDFTTYYLEYIHQNFPISTEQYMELLTCMISKIEKTKRIRSGSITEQEKNEIVFEKISFNNQDFKHKFNSLTTEHFVTWLYSK
tara:strand:- start:7764 stop:8567 length:804 start_codon:yes stop_codon:yes gene_type:complete